MQAIDIMTRDVATTTADAPLATAIRLMLDRHVSGLPVLDQAQTLVGIITEGDLLRRVELGTEHHRAAWLEFLLGPNRLATEYVVTHSRIVGDIMTPDVHAVEETTPLADIVTLMQKHHVKRVPVLAKGRLVGVVSRSDLLRTLATEIPAPTLTPPADQAIQKAVSAELARQPWAPRGGITVEVAEGIVTFQGCIFDGADRDALRVAAQNVPGVRSVVDRLVWVEPSSGMTYQPIT